MTRKHFREAALIVKRTRNKAERRRTAIRFATLFRKFAIRFDSDKFFEACEVK